MAVVRTYLGRTSVYVMRASSLRLTTRSAGVSSFPQAISAPQVYISYKQHALTVCVCVCVYVQILMSARTPIYVQTGTA